MCNQLQEDFRSQLPIHLTTVGKGARHVRLTCLSMTKTSALNRMLEIDFVFKSVLILGRQPTRS